MPKASIIIVNYNAGKWLEKSVQSVLEQSEQDFECFIVDNGSTDGSMQTLPKLDERFRIIELGENTGFAKANNIAAKQAKSPWLALLNPDAFARNNWLEELLKAVQENPKISMVGSTQYLALAKIPTLDGIGDCYHFSGIAYRAGFGKQIEPPNDGYVFAPCAAACLYSRRLFLELGGFDEMFFCYHEDVDLGFRMQLAGYDCLQSSKAIIDHISSGTSNKVSGFAVYHGTRNRIWTFIKNMPLPLLILFLPFHILANLSYLVWAIFRKGRFVPTLKGIIDAIKGLYPIIKARKKVQKNRKTSSLALLNKFTYSPLKVIKRDIHIRKKN